MLVGQVLILGQLVNTNIWELLSDKVAKEDMVLQEPNT